MLYGIIKDRKVKTGFHERELLLLAVGGKLRIGKKYSQKILCFDYRKVEMPPLQIILNLLNALFYVMINY